MAEHRLALRRFATVLTGEPRTADELVGDALSWVALRWDRVGPLARPAACIRALIVNDYLLPGRRPRRSITSR